MHDPEPATGPRAAGRAIALRAVRGGVAALAALVLAACSAPVTPPRPTTSATPSRPNIVLVLADDYAMNLVAHMPNLVRLQRDGRTMDRHYVVDSLCCPSRSSILTGRYPHDTGVFTNAGTDGGIDAFHTYGDQEKTFAVALHAAGYRTGFMGKYLNGYEPTAMAPDPGWDEWDVGGGGGYAELGYTLNENGRTVRYGHDPADYMVDVLAGKAARFIRGSARSGHPFLLEVSTYAPHAPYAPPARYAGTMKDVPYPRTAAWDATVRNAPRWLRGHVPLRPAEKAAIAHDWEGRLEADLAVDDLIGTIRQAVAAAGATRDTVIAFTSDNGLHMGEYRLIPGKETAYDTDVQVPLIVAGPGIPAGTSTDALTSSIDLAPTFLALAGLPADRGMDGASLLPVWRGRSPAQWQEGVLIEHHHRQGVPSDPDLQNARGADPPGYSAVRTRDAVYVRYVDGEEEYYDTRSDPDELVNLGGGAAPDRLRRMLDALVHCHGAAACRSAARTG